MTHQAGLKIYLSDHLACGGVSKVDVAADVPRHSIVALLLPHEVRACHLIMSREIHRGLRCMASQQVHHKDATSGVQCLPRMPEVHLHATEAHQSGSPSSLRSAPVVLCNTKQCIYYCRCKC